MFVADLGGEVAMGLWRSPTLANHCAQRASFALLQGKWIEFRELTYNIQNRVLQRDVHEFSKNYNFQAIYIQFTY